MARFQKNKLYIKFDDENFLRDNFGFIVSKSDFVELIKETREFYRDVTDEEIEVINERINQDKIESYGYEKKLKTKVSKTGYVYLIQADGKHFKIGITSNVNSRFKALQSASPNELKLINYTKTININELEYKLHKYFTKLGKHVRGEWYDLNKDDLEFVGRIFDKHDIRKGENDVRC